MVRSAATPRVSNHEARMPAPAFAAIEAWNAAGVYQRAIALMGRQIDGDGASAAR